MLPAGKLRHRLTLQRDQNLAVNPAGGGQLEPNFQQPTANWQTLATTWAEIAPWSGREPWVGDAVQADVTHKIRMRFNPNRNLTPRDRGVFQGRVFNFLAVHNILEGSVETQIAAIEQV
jgi:head-tail adaptor